MKNLSLLFVSLLLVGCNSSSNKYKGTWENIIANDILSVEGGNVSPFNTVMNLKYFVNEDIKDKENLINDVKSIYQETITDLHKKYDRHFNYYIDDNNKELGQVNNIKTINSSLDSNEFVKVSKETFDLLKLGVEYTKYTNSYFNIFTGSLTDFWDEIFNEAYNFSDLSLDPYFNEEQKARLEKLVNAIPVNNEDIDKVLEFKEDTYEVKFNSLKDENNNPKGNISISVGGIAKGVATNVVKEKLLAKGYDKGYLFSGGSSISSISTPIYNNSDGQYLSVSDPRTVNLFGDDKKAAFGINLKEEFNMSTSGNYTTGKSYGFYDENLDVIKRFHIINTFTGYSNYNENVASVSVFSKKLDAGILDAFSTTLVNMSIEEGIEFRKKVMNDFDCDLEIVYIKENIKEKTIEVISTSNFNKTLKLVNTEGSSLRYV